jgi:adenylosuccinate synthase
MKAVVMVVDLQFGSTGKGQIAGTVGRVWQPDTVVCANGPNAGHTYKWWEEAPGYTKELRKVIHTVTPVTSVLPSVRNILLGPGAVIDISKLHEEVQAGHPYFNDKQLIIHPNASIVTQDHRDREKNFIGIGSTMKGTAEAVIEKMRRLPGANIARHWASQLENLLAHAGLRVYVDESAYNAAIDSSRKLLVEGAQGSSLSMHSRFYPHTTSRDVSINQIWADCRLPAVTNSSFQDSDIQIIGVCRTYPIRVANRVNEQGDIIGYSGSCYPDQKEITWDSIGREAELTTVTKLPRRLFTFSTQQILEAVRFNAPTSIALTFCDYLASHNEDHPEIPEGMVTFPVNVGAQISPCVMSYIRRLEAAATCNVDFVSFGPTDADIYSPDANRLGNLYLPWGI